MQNENHVLELLKSPYAYLIYDPLAGTVNLYKADPAAGSPRSSMIAVDLNVFESMRGRGLIEKTRGREQVRYEITALGRASGAK
jgi:hypothetical protein